jgi:hypothetical protein
MLAGAAFLAQAITCVRHAADARLLTRRLAALQTSSAE